MPNRSKEKGDRFERSILIEAESMGLKGYRNRMSRAQPGESWDLSIAGRRLECKKRKAGFKKISDWIEGNDGLILGADRGKPLVVIRLDDWLKLL